jgi:hypothetical protein
MTLRGIFLGTTMRWATMMMISRIVLMRSALKHLIVAGIEIHKLTSLNISSVLFCGKDSSSIRNSL